MSDLIMNSSIYFYQYLHEATLAVYRNIQYLPGCASMFIYFFAWWKNNLGRFVVGSEQNQ